MGGIEETTWPTLEGFVWGKQFRAIFASPITGRQIALGVVWVSVLRTVVTVILYWAVLLVFGAVDLRSAPALIALCTIAGVAFSAFMLAVTVRVKNDDAFMSLFYRFALMPLFLFSGTFYPLDTLNLAVRWIGWVSPLWHATELGRWLSYGHSLPGVMLATHSGFLLAMLAGGVSRPDSLYTQMGFAQLRALATTGRCTPFDAAASGLIVGEGAGVVIAPRAVVPRIRLARTPSASELDAIAPAGSNLDPHDGRRVLRSRQDDHRQVARVVTGRQCCGGR